MTTEKARRDRGAVEVDYIYTEDIIVHRVQSERSGNWSSMNGTRQDA